MGLRVCILRASFGTYLGQIQDRTKEKLNAKPCHSLITLCKKRDPLQPQASSARCDYLFRCLLNTALSDQYHTLRKDVFCLCKLFKRCFMEVECLYMEFRSSEFSDVCFADSSGCLFCLSPPQECRDDRSKAVSEKCTILFSELLIQKCNFSPWITQLPFLICIFTSFQVEICQISLQPAAERYSKLQTAIHY